MRVGVFMSLCVDVCACVRARVCVCMCVCSWIFADLRGCTWTCASAYVCMFVCMRLALTPSHIYTYRHICDDLLRFVRFRGCI